MDVMQALFGQKNSAFMTAAGFSDSPHFFYSGMLDAKWKIISEMLRLF